MKNLIQANSIKATGLENFVGPMDLLVVSGQLVEGAKIQTVIVSTGTQKHVAKIDGSNFTTSFAFKDGVPATIEIEAIDADGDFEKITRSVTVKRK